jgi:microcystin-dependent protein
VTLLESEMPAHNHFARANTQDPADIGLINPNASFAQSTGGSAYTTTSNTQMAFQALPPAGGGQPHNNMMRYLTLNFCIALQGVFPARP